MMLKHNIDSSGYYDMLINKIMFRKISDFIIISLFIDNKYLRLLFNCHQISSRSFFWKGRQFHICARCTGIFVGVLFSPSMLIFWKYSIYIFPLSFIVLSIDGVTQLFKLRESNNLLRFITGFFFGYSFLSFVVYTIMYLFRELH